MPPSETGKEVGAVLAVYAALLILLSVPFAVQLAARRPPGRLAYWMVGESVQHSQHELHSQTLDASALGCWRS